MRSQVKKTTLMTNFKIKPVTTQTLGEYLRGRREQLRYSLEEAAKLSRVQPKYLLALEEERLSDLPAPVYVNGFLKSLAEVYRLPVGELTRQYAAELELASQVQSFEKPRKSAQIGLRFVFSPKTVVFLLVGTLGLGSATYLYFQVTSLRRPPAIQVFSPHEDGLVSSSLLLVRGQTEPGASVYLNNQPIVVDAEGSFQESLSLAPGGNQLTLRSVNKFGRESVVRRQVIFFEKEIAGALSAASVLDAAADGVSVEVKVGPNATWIRLVSDGQEIYSGTMLPDSSRSVTANERVSLTTGNAGSTRISLNGRDLGRMGKEGELIKDIEFTPAP